MNIHINKTTRFQAWEGRTVFGEYPVFIRPGNFTVTLLFHDKESINRLCRLLLDMVAEIEAEMLTMECPSVSSIRKKRKNSGGSSLAGG